jgi:hypothetical protein
VQYYFGEPDGIDTVSAPGKHVLMCSYLFTDPRAKPPEQFRGVWQVPQNNLVMEFVNDSLYGYVYNNSRARSSTNFGKELRRKIMIGRANKSTVHGVLGEPAGKIMLPTTLFGHPLLQHLAHSVPQNASEAWCYYYDYSYYRAGSRRRFEYYKFLAVYFNTAGAVVDKFFTESEKTEPRITRIYTN